MTDGLPQRDPGARLPVHLEWLRDVGAVTASRDELDGAVPRSFSRDVETMRRVAERLLNWTGEPPTG